MNLHQPLDLATPEPEPIRRPNPLLELLLFGTLAITLYFAVQVAALAAVVVLAQREQPGVAWNELSRRLAENLQYNVHFLVPVQLLYYAALLILLWLLICRLRGERFVDGAGLRPLPAKYLALGVVAGLIFAPVIQVGNLLFPPPEPLLFDKLFTSKTAVWMLLSMAVFAAPLMEELVFRGYLYGVLERLGGPRLAIYLSGILFGSIHFPQLYPGLFQMALICVVGIAFSFARARTGTVVAAIAVHFGYNLALSLLYFISPHFRSLPP